MTSPISCEPICHECWKAEDRFLGFDGVWDHEDGLDGWMEWWMNGGRPPRRRKRRIKKA